ncbi:anti-phage defense-associated sirtuin Dsr2 [Oligosphaera ethanolica]|uniref:SIR2-like domain-containing protein n=1 Tax=Oligosphaera ethanolica TaxID=760260 RepID=A0AAE3VH54_9BACT|nr:anti-phage defense-associated sirtuin Dsr2 [Oligosphaera ethanolica]MDQ0290311.1 hypothetical protein [Oligosphaera ethanolica]
MSNDVKVNLPDSIRPYVDEIAERLWAGRAAVMVGAGFSKNAGEGFPDWNQLGDQFYQKAHGSKPDAEKHRYLNVLRLAEEVQAAIGRPALEYLLRSSIPDLDVEPSQLHVDLLKLPWADVFTTNYDTLLERASANVLTRRYEPVVNKEDIPYAIKPRIVKLHGSFPSERPFIITEEDYRRYPHDYAPFVNTVQQALLENTFCLIGFSGDDANFQKWIGWIRDNLGKDKTQKIYLVGVFALSSAGLELLAQRGITVVDLSCCDGVEKNDHKQALSIFIKYLWNKNPNALDWPDNSSSIFPPKGGDNIEEVQKITAAWRKQRQIYPGWLILPYSNREKVWVYTQSWVSFLPDTEKSLTGVDLQYAYEMIWRLERCLLPVLSNIRELCEKLLEKYWPFPCKNMTANCQVYQGKEEYRDLPWDDLRQAWLAIAVAVLRFYREKGLLEKWKEMEGRLKGLEQYLSAEQQEFLHYEGFLFSLFTLDLPGAKQRLDNWRPNPAQPYWMTKRAAAYAEIGQQKDIDDQMRSWLVESRKQNNYHAASPSFLSLSDEAFQMLLLRYVEDANDLIEVKPARHEEEKLIKDELFNEWKQGKRKAESEPERQEKSTIKPRDKFQSPEEDWMSLDANRSGSRSSDWNRFLQIVRNNQRQLELQQQNARWDELKAFRCDPWNELKLFELALKNPPVQMESVTVKRGFDIGRAIISRHSGRIDQEALSAYAFLRFCEEVGLPYRVGIYALATKTAQACLSRISRYSPFWALATLVRIGDEKGIDDLFSRDLVWKFTEKEADSLICNYLDALNKCREDIHEGNAFRNDNFAVRLTQLLPEVISRLCCKCSSAMKQRILEFVSGIYASPDKTNYRKVGNLTKRLFGSMSERERYRLVPDLLKIPYPENLNPIVKDEFPNPLPLLGLDDRPQGTSVLAIQPELVTSLFQEAASEQSDRRRWAVSSLVTLYKLQLLGGTQRRRLARAIWRVTDHYGLPDGTDFYKFAFLPLPHPDGVDPVPLFKTYVKSTQFPIQKNKQDKSVSITWGNIPIVQEIIGASQKNNTFWTAAEAAEILQRLLEWWDADKDRLKEKRDPSGFSSVPNEFRSRFLRLIEVLAEAVGPALSADSPGRIRESLQRLLREIREYGLPGLTAEVACLHLCPNQRNELYARIKDALTVSQDEIQRDGLNAIAKLIFPNQAADACILGHATCAGDSDPISLLSQFLSWSPTPSLYTALWIVKRILKESPSHFVDSLEMATLSRLNRLLTDTAYANDIPDCPFEEKLTVRSMSSFLAAELWSYYNTRNIPLPDAITKWRDACLSPDEFAEIRNPWVDRDRS